MYLWCRLGGCWMWYRCLNWSLFYIVLIDILFFQLLFYNLYVWLCLYDVIKFQHKLSTFYACDSVCLTSLEFIWQCTFSLAIYTAICLNGCLHGNCTAPDNCTCELGWSGDSCSIGNTFYHGSLIHNHSSFIIPESWQAWKSYCSSFRIDSIKTYALFSCLPYVYASKCRLQY